MLTVRKNVDTQQNKYVCMNYDITHEDKLIAKYIALENWSSMEIFIVK